jgi:thioesterase domain-containing protein
MSDREALCDELAEKWHREIPIVVAMGITVERYDGRSLTVRGLKEPNRNAHGTTFAGSLYSACVLTGWGAVWLAFREQGVSGVIYAAEGTVRYRRAVDGDFVCVCAIDEEALRVGIQTFKESGRATFELGCTIESDGKRAVTFTGKYIAHEKHA